MKKRALDWGRAYVAGDAVPGRTLADLALAPAEVLYRAVVAARRTAYERGLLPRAVPSLPVLAVGNLLVGGAGKTPVTAYLARRVAALGALPAVVHGGYAPDEPALHRLWNPDIPVFVGRARARAIEEASAAGADVVLLDDAFQHLRVVRSADLVLVPVERWQARPRLLPRGPWREAPAALASADLIGLAHRGADPGRVEEVRRAVTKVVAPPVAEFHLDAVGWRRLEAAPAREAPPRGASDGDAEAATPAGSGLAVCGVADPEGFRRSATRAGATVESALTYGDHHEYDAGDLRHIERTAAGRPVLTTEKDAVKLASLAARVPVWVLRERVRLGAGADAVEELLRGLLR